MNIAQAIVNYHTYGNVLMLPKIDEQKMDQAIAAGKQIVIARKWESGCYYYALNLCVINSNGEIENVQHPEITEGTEILNVEFKDNYGNLVRPGEFESSGRGDEYKAIVAYAVDPKYTAFQFDESYGIEEGEKPNMILCQPGLKDVFEKTFSVDSDVFEEPMVITKEIWEEIKQLAENLKESGITTYYC